MAREEATMCYYPQARTFFHMLCLATTWDHTKSLLEVGYPEVNVYAYSGRLMSNRSIQMTASFLGLFLPTSFKAQKIDKNQIAKYLEHNRMILRKIGLADFREMFEAYPEFKTDRTSREFLEPLLEKNYGYEEKAWLEQVNSTPVRPTDTIEDVLDEMDDTWLLRRYMAIAENRNCDEKTQMIALDKIAKIQGSYRQNKQAVSEFEDANIEFKFNSGGYEDDGKETETD